jgi:hypothetical protein
MDIPREGLFRFGRGQMLALGETHCRQFTDAAPFPHVVIPDFLPITVARALAYEFPAIQDHGWCLAGPGDSVHTGDINIEKVQNDREEHFPPFIRHMMHEFNSSTFLDFLMILTGYTGLLSDPWFGGCGLHSTGRGGRLMIHADEDRHPNPKLHQILNAIYYVTPDWRDEWGGHLELWDDEARTCVRRIAPTFNSLVVFYTGRRSFHGHPHPLQTPAGIRRNSLAAYYYTTDRTLDDDYDGRISRVIWKQTNKHDRMTAKTRVLNAARVVLPEPVFRKAAGVWAALMS